MPTQFNVKKFSIYIFIFLILLGASNLWKTFIEKRGTSSVNLDEPDQSLPIQSRKTSLGSEQLDEEIIGDDGAPMVLVPGGKFTMGARDDDSIALVDEKPRHTVFLNTFYIDRFEVTTGRYAVYMKESRTRRPNFWTTKKYLQERPVVSVNWYDAIGYCAYYGKRLPTEAEWEKAARGTDERLYPWGNNPPTHQLANYGEGHFGRLYEVGLRNVGSIEAGKSPYGVYEMAGNAWEWVSDFYDGRYYKKSPMRNPQGPLKGACRVLRGGTWWHMIDTKHLRSTDRNCKDPENTNHQIGFRCAKDAT